MAKTKNGIVYPDNYDKVADVPADLKELAESVDEVIENNKTEMKKSNETRDGKISKNTENIEAIQGSIKTAIETINKKDNEQDEDIKANKESIEELKAENLEIKVENERLRNDIKSIALQGEANGENIHLEDSSEARCEIKICGNQKQNTREGYNLLNLEKYAYSETISNINGGKIEVSKGIVNLNGTNATARMTAKSKDIASSEFDIIPAGTYFFGVNCNLVPVSGGSLLQPKLGIQELKEDYYLTQWYAICDVNKTESYPLLISKDTQKTTYEQYGASPSIDYPSPVKSVGNIKNILDMSNAKGGTSNGITCTMNKDGSYQYVGTATSTVVNVWLLGKYGDSLPGIFTLEAGTYYINNAYIFDGTSALNADTNKKIYTFINKHKITGVRVPAAVVGQEYNETKYPIIAKIDHEIPWIPYDCGYEKIDIFNKNIFKEKANKKDIKKAYINIISGILNIKKGEIYIISFDTNNNQGGLYLNEDIFLFQGQHNITCDGKRHYLIGKAKDNINKNVTILKTLKETTNNYDISNVLVTKYDASNVDTKYIEHQEQSYLVDVQQEMLEGDYLDLENEKENHEWGKYIFTGDEDYNKSSTYSNEKYFCGYIPTPVATNIKVDGKGICNYFNNFGDYVQITDKECIRIWGQFQVRILASHLTENSAEAFKAWLKSKYDEGNPVVVYYQLETPIELDFTEAQKAVAKKIKSEAHTYKNITNISAESSEVNPIVNVKYLKDTEAEHNKLQAQIDEIKELLSSTATSAMLLNNMQTDLESEV